MATVALCIITDGRRETLVKTLESAAASLIANFDYKILIDDSANADYAAFLDRAYPFFDIIHHEQRRGLGGAVHSAWSAVLATDCTHVFHLEDDFIFVEPVDVGAMIEILDTHKFLAQVALKRQPVNQEEIAAGDFMATDPGAYWNQDGYVEHTTIFTYNPFVAPRRVLQLANDHTTPMLERDVTNRLLASSYRFGYLGAKEDAPRVTHIGEARSIGWRP